MSKDINNYVYVINLYMALYWANFKTADFNPDKLPIETLTWFHLPRVHSIKIYL